MGRRLNAALSEVIEDGFTFRVDMALRPNGKSGPLAASLNMVEEYLIVQGREWERYAWVKARAVTGSLEDIAALDAIVRPFVFRRYLDFGVIDAIRNMHAQIRAEVTGPGRPVSPEERKRRLASLARRLEAIRQRVAREASEREGQET